jgi:hypothetical protein
MNDDEKLLLESLRPTKIKRYADQIRASTHEPEDAKLLLLKFCALVDEEAEIPRELLQHIRDSLGAYFEDGAKLETAFGLTQGVKRSGISPADEMAIVVEIMEARLQGSSHQDALEEISRKYGWGTTVIGKAFKRAKDDREIMGYLRIYRHIEGRMLSNEERENVERILRGKRPIIQSGGQ